MSGTFSPSLLVVHDLPRSLEKYEATVSAFESTHRPAVMPTIQPSLRELSPPRRPSTGLATWMSLSLLQASLPSLSLRGARTGLTPSNQQQGSLCHQTLRPPNGTEKTVFLDDSECPHLLFQELRSFSLLRVKHLGKNLVDDVFRSLSYISGRHQ